jgi:hypothetical protein
MGQEAQTGQIFLGVYYAGQEHGLVALFEADQQGARSGMTIGALCDRIEQQMATGQYYHARAKLAVDRAALQALIESQRKVFARKARYGDYPPLVDVGVIADGGHNDVANSLGCASALNGQSGKD